LLLTTAAILGQRGSDTAREAGYILGVNCQAVLRRCIVAGVDGSPNSLAALQWGGVPGSRVRRRSHIETPEGRCRPDVDGDIPVVGKERGQPMKHLVRGSVSSYCREHPNCPVLAVPPAGVAW
jgi:hypothetical protein